MYAGTIFNWHDNSAFEVETTSPIASNQPLFMVVAPFDKGPENLMEIDSRNFNSIFGKSDFDRFGQISLEAQNIIDAGGRLLIKRVCAYDSTLANMVLCAKVSVSEATETAGAVTTVSWVVKSTDSAKTFAEVEAYAKSLRQNDDSLYPLFVFTDNGRGTSNKAMRIIPDYDTSKGLVKMLYKLNIYEGTTLTESISITLDPDYIFDNENYGLTESRNVQISGKVIPSIYEEFIDLMIQKIPFVSTNLTDEEKREIAKSYDLIFGYTYTGESFFAPGTAITLKWDFTSDGTMDPNASYGIPFSFKDTTNDNIACPGNNGQYTDSPATEEHGYVYNDIAAVYMGYNGNNGADPTEGIESTETIDEVWDVDSHKLFCVPDANFPDIVKTAIKDFVDFRKDCMFFRDICVADQDGKLYNNLNSIKQRYNDLTGSVTQSYFTSDFLTSYEIEDPNTKKNIRVTALYDIVTCLTRNYINNGPFAPVAGSYNGYILDSAIPGTINYVPIITPTVNQKQAIDDLRLNYAIFEEGRCVVQSAYTSQKKNTQLSFTNNVLSIQEVARVVRKTCPRNRFRLITGSDMSEYARAVTRVLEGYQSYFDLLEFTYTEDKLRAVQKIFYAQINFSFNNWAQTEIFDLFALSQSTSQNL